ncbi:hypothetical protein [Fusobacterium sp.]|uniref:hypothetical protein n=1 Tax=Fusobacterium sp. TaxID=68766 RepID=UPI0025BC2D0B|nr:hypothetical protein [Fusobacterium sp.]
MLTLEERVELEKLEKINKEYSAGENRELEDEYVYDNRLGAFLLLASYCGIGVFFLYKLAELLLLKI